MASSLSSPNEATAAGAHTHYPTIASPRIVSSPRGSSMTTPTPCGPRTARPSTRGSRMSRASSTRTTCSASTRTCCRHEQARGRKWIRTRGAGTDRTRPALRCRALPPNGGREALAKSWWPRRGTPQLAGCTTAAVVDHVRRGGSARRVSAPSRGLRLRRRRQGRSRCAPGDR